MIAEHPLVTSSKLSSSWFRDYDVDDGNCTVTCGGQTVRQSNAEVRTQSVLWSLLVLTSSFDSLPSLVLVPSHHSKYGILRLAIALLEERENQASSQPASLQMETQRNAGENQASSEVS